MIISSNYSFTFTYFNWHPPNGKKVEKSTIKFFTIIIKHTVPNTNSLFKNKKKGKNAEKCGKIRTYKQVVKCGVGENMPL